MKPGNIDVTRLRPAKSQERRDTEAVVGILAALLLIACCCGGGIVGTLWAVIG